MLLTLVVAVGLAGAVAYSSAVVEMRRLSAVIDTQESTIMDLTRSVDLLLKERSAP